MISVSLRCVHLLKFCSQPQTWSSCQEWWPWKSSSLMRQRGRFALQRISERIDDLSYLQSFQLLKGLLCLRTQSRDRDAPLCETLWVYEYVMHLGRFEGKSHPVLGKSPLRIHRRIFGHGQQEHMFLKNERSLPLRTTSLPLFVFWVVLAWGLSISTTPALLYPCRFFSCPFRSLGRCIHSKRKVIPPEDIWSSSGCRNHGCAWARLEKCVCEEWRTFPQTPVSIRSSFRTDVYLAIPTFLPTLSFLVTQPGLLLTPHCQFLAPDASLRYSLERKNCLSEGASRPWLQGQSDWYRIQKNVPMDLEDYPPVIVLLWPHLHGTCRWLKGIHRLPHPEALRHT